MSFSGMGRTIDPIKSSKTMTGQTAPLSIGFDESAAGYSLASLLSNKARLCFASPHRFCNNRVFEKTKII